MTKKKLLLKRGKFNSFQDGGIEQEIRGYVYEKKPKDKLTDLSLLDLAKYGISRTIMDLGEYAAEGYSLQSAPKETYLMDRESQEKVLLNRGYVKGKNEDYGTVKSAVGSRDIPVYQTLKDSISREDLLVMGNVNNLWLGPREATMEDPGSFSSAIYVDPISGKLYQKAWDLNDYGDKNRVGKGRTYNDGTFKGKVLQKAANIVDAIGSPTVITTGFQPIKTFIGRNQKDVSLSNIPSKFLNGTNFQHAVAPFIHSKGLDFTKLDDGTYAVTLPEVVITSEGNNENKDSNKKAEGGPIEGPYWWATPEKSSFIGSNNGMKLAEGLRQYTLNTNIRNAATSVDIASNPLIDNYSRIASNPIQISKDITGIPDKIDVKVGGKSLAEGPLTNQELGIASKVPTSALNKIGAGISGVAGIVGAGINNAKIKDTSEYQTAIDRAYNTTYSGDANSILAQYEANKPIQAPEVENLKLGLGTKISNTLGAVTSGAMAGSTLGGPWGAAIGGAAGLVSGITGAIVGDRKAKREAERLNTKALAANQASINNLNVGLTNAGEQELLYNLARTAKYGGKINIKPSKRGTFTRAAKSRGLGVQEFASKVLSNPDNYSEAMRKKAQFAKNASKWHANGGPLFNEFSNGITQINEGGTHEFIIGQEYDVTDEEIELLKKLGYEFEYI